MADLVTENKHLKQIVQSKDQALLNLQLQVLQLSEANNVVEGCDCKDCDCKDCDCKEKKSAKGTNDEQTKSDEVPTSNSKSGK